MAQADRAWSIGTYQVRSYWGQCQRSHFEWQTRYRHMAGYMVSRVQRWQTEEKGAGYSPRREDVGYDDIL